MAANSLVPNVDYEIICNDNPEFNRRAKFMQQAELGDWIFYEFKTDENLDYEEAGFFIKHYMGKKYLAVNRVENKIEIICNIMGNNPDIVEVEVDIKMVQVFAKGARR